MRMIGQVQGEAPARRFSDFLLVQGIENQVEADKDGAWAVWVHADEDLERAKILLADYRQNPADPKFQRTARAADDLKEKKRREQAAYVKKLKQRRHLFRNLTGYGFGPVTFILIFISAAVFLRSNFGRDMQTLHQLYISDVDLRVDGHPSTWELFNLRLSHWRIILPEIRQGELWRLFTPMFIHMGVLHILFNMMWLRDLGSMIEARQTSWLLALMVLAMALVSNLAQYLFHGPDFGGMSGVVYGLMGYIWIRGKLDPGSGLFLHPSTVTMMIIWFFLCLSGMLGPIANYAHGAGLLMGMAWGWLSSLRHR